MKIFIFLVGIEVCWGLMGSNNLINWWDITPPFMYCVFHHIYDPLQTLILFWQFNKKVAIRSDPPPWLGQKTKFVKGKISVAPLTIFTKWSLPKWSQLKIICSGFLDGQSVPNEHISWIRCRRPDLTDWPVKIAHFSCQEACCMHSWMI